MRRAFAASALLLLSAVLSAQEPQVPVGALGVNGDLVLEDLQHGVQRGMAVTPDGVGKRWTFDPDAPQQSVARADFGETLFMTAAARPTASLYGDASFSYLGNYADTFWRPINDLHRQEVSGEKLRFRRGEAGWTGDDGYLRLLQGKAYEDWRDKGDLFNLIPRQYEVERYLNFSGHAVPRVVEGEWRSPAGEFGFIGGPEPVWGGKHGVMGRYRYRFPSLDVSYIYKDESVLYGDPDERTHAMSLTFSGRAGSLFDYDAGLLYQPFRLNRPFQRAEKTAPGQGDFGSGIHLIDDVTRRQDAWGATVRLSRALLPVLDRGEVGYSVRRPVAGNVEEVSVGAEKLMTSSLSSHLNYLYRRPIIGPLPFLYQGPSSNPGALLSNPRGPDAPFWVFWRPEGDVVENREAQVFTWTAVQDPTPQTRIYKGDADVLEFDNINPKEDARRVFLAQYRLSYYPGSTDRSFYHDKDGRVVWEPAYHSGAWPTRRPLHEGILMALLQSRNRRSVTRLRAGQSLALADAAYTDKTTGFKPVTTYCSAEESYTWNATRLMGSIGYGVWGPEEINQRFGQTFDRLIRGGVEQDLPWDDMIGVSYTWAREDDRQYIAQDLGAFAEWRFYFVQRFSVLGIFREPKERSAKRSVLPEAPAAAPEAGPVPLSVRVFPDREVFEVGSEGEGKLRIGLGTTHPRQMAQWSLKIRDGAGNVVKSFSGYLVPKEVFWNGTDLQGRTVQPGTYRLNFEVREGGDRAESGVEIEVRRP